MPELISDVGDYRGSVLAGAVSTTTNDYPQLVLELHATDVYDRENGEWYPDAIDGTLTAYLCLFGGNGKATLAVQQVIDTFGWDGKSFKGLNDLVQAVVERGMPIGFSTKENEYEGNVGIQVSWIRAFDDIPTRGVKTCTPEELKNLDHMYAHGLQAAAAKAKSKTAAAKSTTGPKPPAKSAFQKGVETGAITATQAEITGTTPPPVAPATKAKATATGKSTKGKAWIKITKANKAEADAVKKTGGGAGFDDSQLAEIWQTTIQATVGEGVSQNQITARQWYQIQEECVAQVTVPF